MEFSGQIDRDGIRCTLRYERVNGVGHGRVVGCQSREHLSYLRTVASRNFERAVLLPAARMCLVPKCVESTKVLCQTSSFGESEVRAISRASFTMA